MRALVIVVGLLGCGRSEPAAAPEPPKPFAAVDGETITRSAFADALIEAQGEAFFPRFVEEYLVRREAQKAGFTVADADVHKAVDELVEDTIKTRFAGNREGFEKSLGTYGLTLETWRVGRLRERRTWLLAEQLVARETFDERVRELFEQRYGKGGVQRTLRHVLVSTNVATSRFYTRADYEKEKPEILRQARRKAADVRRALVEGAKIDALAAKHSDDFSAEKGGALHANWSGRYGKAFDGAIERLSVGEVSPVIEGRRGYHVAQVVGIRKGARYTGAHLFFKARAEDGVDEAARFAAALARATAARGRILGGEPLGKVAAEVSEDPVSRPKGGALGAFGPGRLGAEVDAVLEAMPLEQLSAPIRVGDGYQLVRLDKREWVPAEDRPLVSHVLVSTDYVKVKARRLGPDLEKRAQEKAERLLAEAQAPGADLQALAREHSEDELTRRNGGLLPRVLGGRYGDAFEGALKDMKPGDVKLVRSPLGFHILQLEAEAVSDFSKVRADLEKEVGKRGVSDEAIRGYVQGLREKAKVERLGPVTPARG